MLKAKPRAESVITSYSIHYTKLYDFDSADQLRETVRLARFNEQIALRKFELSGQGYESGLVTQGSLDEARQNYLSAQLKVLSARNALETGIIDLANALNVEETALYAKEN